MHGIARGNTSVQPIPLFTSALGSRVVKPNVELPRLVNLCGVEVGSESQFNIIQKEVLYLDSKSRRLNLIDPQHVLQPNYTNLQFGISFGMSIKNPPLVG